MGGRRSWFWRKDWDLLHELLLRAYQMGKAAYMHTWYRGARVRGRKRRDKIDSSCRSCEQKGRERETDVVDQQALGPSPLRAVQGFTRGVSPLSVADPPPPQNPGSLPPHPAAGPWPCLWGTTRAVFRYAVRCRQHCAPFSPRSESPACPGIVTNDCESTSQGHPSSIDQKFRH